MNLGSPDNSSNSRPFCDLLLTASDWSRELGLWDPGRFGVEIGPRGWPKGLVRGRPPVKDVDGELISSDQVVFVRLGGSQGDDFPGVTLPPESRLQPGKYEFRLSGKGAIQLQINYADGTADQTAYAIDGPVTIPVEFAKPVHPFAAFRITASDSKDPLIPESFRLAGSQGIWNPAYTDPLKIFPTLRVMDLLLANDSTVTDSYPDHYTVASNTGAGVVPEWLGELSERTGADLWVNVSDTYTDLYVRAMAERIKSTLPPGRKVVVEFSNETWNYGKSQTLRIQAEGKANYPGLSEQEALYRNSARRALIVHHIFADVFGEDRIVRVLGGQAPWSHPAEVMFDEYVGVFKSPPPDLALCGYIGRTFGLPENRAATLALGPDGMRRALLDGPDGVPYAVANWELHRPLLEKYGVKLHVYEGGPHLRQEGGGPDDVPLIELFKDVSDDPGPCCGDLLDAAKRSGVDRFCWFNFTGAESRQGFWPVLQWTGQPPTRKYLALKDHAMPPAPTPDPKPKPRTLADLLAERDRAEAAAGETLRVHDQVKAAEDAALANAVKARQDADAAAKAVDAALPADKAVLLQDGTVIVPPSATSRIVPLVKAADVSV